MTYLKGVKASLENAFIESFERTWKEVVEPALKESFKNGVNEGRKVGGGEGKSTSLDSQSPRSSRHSTLDPDQEA